MSSTTCLLTPRLRLRSFTDADLDAMLAINQDREVMQYFPACPQRAETRAFLKHCQRHEAKYGYALYAVERRDTDTFIGFVGLNRPSFSIPHFVPKGLPTMEIGWRLAKEHWGQGFATEAAQVILDRAFTVHHLPEVISFTAQINRPSRRVMEKIGLRCDPTDAFDHPKLPARHALCPHVLSRLSAHNYGQLQHLTVPSYTDVPTPR